MSEKFCRKCWEILPERAQCCMCCMGLLETISSMEKCCHQCGKIMRGKFCSECGKILELISQEAYKHYLDQQQQLQQIQEKAEQPVNDEDQTQFGSNGNAGNRNAQHSLSFNSSALQNKHTTAEGSQDKTTQPTENDDKTLRNTEKQGLNAETPANKIGQQCIKNNKTPIDSIETAVETTNLNDDKEKQGQTGLNDQKLPNGSQNGKTVTYSGAVKTTDGSKMPTHETATLLHLSSQVKVEKGEKKKNEKDKSQENKKNLEEKKHEGDKMDQADKKNQEHKKNEEDKKQKNKKNQEHKKNQAEKTDSEELKNRKKSDSDGSSKIEHNKGKSSEVDKQTKRNEQSYTSNKLGISDKKSKEEKEQTKESGVTDEKAPRSEGVTTRKQSKTKEKQNEASTDPLTSSGNERLSYASAASSSAKNSTSPSNVRGHVHRYENKHKEPDKILMLKPTIGKDTIKMHFKAFIPINWEGKVYIYFGNYYLGDWKFAALEMKRSRFDKDYDGLHGEFDLLLDNLGLHMPYKYVVYNEQTKVKEYEHLEISDHAYQDDTFRNRVLIIPKERKGVSDCFYQFDDLVLPKYKPTTEKGFKVWFKNLLFGSNENSNLKDHRKKSAERIFLHYFQSCSTSNLHKFDAITALWYMNDLYTSFYEAQSEYYIQKDQWEKFPSKSQTKKIVENVLGKHLKKNSEVLNGQGTLEEKATAFVFSMSFLPVLNKIRKAVPTELAMLLMRCLSLENFEHEPTFLKKYFSTKVLGFVLESLKDFWKFFIGFPKILNSICWCLPLRLMHYIEKENGARCFDRKSESDEISIAMCGLFGLTEKNLPQDIDSVENFFKDVQYLKRSFTMDIELQRTLVYIMPISYLPTAFNIGFKKRLLIRKMLTNLKRYEFKQSDDLCQSISVLSHHCKHVDNKELCHLTVLLIDLLVHVLPKIESMQILAMDVIELVIECTSRIRRFMDTLDVEFLEMFQKYVREKERLLEQAFKNLTLHNSWAYGDVPTIAFFLNILSSLENVDMFSPEFQTCWKQALVKRTKRFLDSLCYNQPTKFLTVYLESHYEGFMHEIFDKVFEENIEEFLYEKGFLSWATGARQTEMLYKHLESKWKEHKTDDEIFDWIMDWNPFKVIFKQFWDKKGLALSEIMEKASDVLQKYVGNLYQSNLTFKDFNTIKRYKTKFFEIFEIIQPDGINGLKKEFQSKEDCFEDYKLVKNIMYLLGLFLKNLPAQLADIRSLYSKLGTKEDNLRFSDIFKNSQSAIEYFQLPKIALPVLREFNDRRMVCSEIFQFSSKETINAILKGDSIGVELMKPEEQLADSSCEFLKALNSYLSMNSEEKELNFPLDLNELVLHVIVPALFLTKSVFMKLVQGSIKIEDAVKYLNIDLRKELYQIKVFFQMDEKEETINLCCKRIDCATKIQSCRDQSEAILEAADNLGLEGDFGSVKKILDEVTTVEGALLNEITEELIADTEKIANITVEMKIVFKAVSDNLNILIWLREHLKDPKEVKVFVEMMSIAAGESDYEVDRVANFEASCQAFSPIIFDLSEESGFVEFGFVEFEEACQKASKSLREDDTIIEKLSDSNKNLEWFKQAKESQGSVSARSFLEAKNANKNGKYIIGNLSENAEDFLEQTATLQHVMRLEVAYEEKIDKTKPLSLDDIHDLQSRLMLLGRDTNKNEENIADGTFEKEYFVKQAETMTRLANAYVQLIEAGDVCYLKWKEEYKCNVEEAKKQHFENYFKQIEMQITKFENRLQNWNNELIEFRKDHPLANLFTVKQILVLRKYLRKYSQELKENIRKLPEDDNQVFSLLRSISNEVTPEKIKECCLLMHGDIYHRDRNKEKEKKKKIEVDDETNFTRFSYKELNVLLKRFREENDDIDENVIMASLVGVPDFSYVKKVIFWCGKNADKEDLIEELSEKAEEELKKMEQNNLHSNDTEENQTSHELTEIINLEDEYLDLTLFRNFLQLFGDALKRRVVPEYLNNNQPNLIIKPRNEILSSVITMYDNDGRGSLPDASEVLLCSKYVTLEQVQLLILRAAFNKNGLYCLVFAEYLDYEKSEKVFHFIQKFMKDGKMGYLVVMCSSEEEHQSYLTSALDSYQTHILHPKKDIEKILHKAFCLKDADNKKGKIIYGSVVDPERYNVRVVTSSRGGMGKSLFIDHKCGELQIYIAKHAEPQQKERFLRYDNVVKTPVHGTSVCFDEVVLNLAKYNINDTEFPRVYHFDVAPTVYEGLDHLFFNIFILGSMQTMTGKIWRKNVADICFVEMTEVHKENITKKSNKGTILKNIPHLECASPEEAYQILQGIGNPGDKVYEDSLLKKSPFQRVYNYLQLFEVNKVALNTYDYDHRIVDTNLTNLLHVLLKYCGISNPSWMELRNFVHFFNKNLIDCEYSVFTSPDLRQEFPGFKEFVVTFLLEMARDFATRSISEDEVAEQNNVIVQLKRTWEQSAHPYLFFNQDRNSMTFFGININTQLQLLDPETGRVLKDTIINPQLYQILTQQMQNDFVNLSTDYNQLSKPDKIRVLCRVMGLPEDNFDPDPTYELTIDNMKKMLAIHMRLRCGVPVVLMGETGCGKTTLIRYMSSLCAGPTQEQTRTPKNMLLVKVHGGVTMNDIKERVLKAKEMASKNKDTKTILFLDEANTTDAIGLIKEIMVDKQLFGKPLGIAHCGLEIVAACNPYRKHTTEMIKKLETAGLGYHVGAVETYEKIGEIPLRQLVYRVHPLPESMKPLVWDFGQLNSETEEIYARQIVQRYRQDGKLPMYESFINLLVKVLAASQLFMRRQEDECSFVSLRDVERAVQVTSWFYQKMELFLPLIKEYDEKQGIPISIQNRNQESIEKQRRSLILALSVCYIARLEERDEYVDVIEPLFDDEFILQDGTEQFKNEIKRFQEMFINQLKLEDNIAKNQALCENVFMMVICIELRIPLFVVGKPGSSKSLAKTIVQDNMQGKNSKSDLFGNFKQVFMSSYQCSPLSTADGIIGVFKQSARFQEGKNLDEYTSVVVLDEVGLAEDSPRMPLKALHPLLEDGTDGSEDLTINGKDTKNKRVAFVGISNWALDPAKMNRGIMLCRSPPVFQELANTARDICASDKEIQHEIMSLLQQLSEGYENIYKAQKASKALQKYKKEEFFGLRDFYSLIKLVFCLAKKCKGVPSMDDIENAVRRNFSGMNEVDSWGIFKSNLHAEDDEEDFASDEDDGDRKMSTVEMIKKSFDKKCPCSSVKENAKRCTSNRYLLVMTEKYSALPIIEGMSLEDKENMSVIFGSSFPKDQEFTQVCRDINRIKMCMETGRTVILLNMENLYESLYDALNQYYVYMGGQRYVDLGLGTHRVKCRVHEDFKLIVMADKTDVYESFPIPLINRLEKHFLVTSTAMNEKQLTIKNELDKWANEYAKIPREKGLLFDCDDAFVGFNNDTCASIVIELDKDGIPNDELLDKCKETLLQIATPESIARLSKEKRQRCWDFYFGEQTHSSLFEFMQEKFPKNANKFYQVTTFSKLLSPQEQQRIYIRGFQFELLSLMQFQTEHSFREALVSTFQKVQGHKAVIMIQYSVTVISGNLVPCAQHICKEIASQCEGCEEVKVLFLLQLHRGAKGLVSFQSTWECVHIDEIRPSKYPTLMGYIDKPISSLFDNSFEWLHIIKGTIQAAMEIVNKTLQMSAQVITQKIDILTKLLDTDDENSDKFRHIVVQQLHKLLVKAEEKSIASDPHKVHNWVPREATELKYVPGYGTFSEALIQCVEEMVKPIWADLIFTMDFNDNLMLVKNSTNYLEIWVDLLDVICTASLRIDPSEAKVTNCHFPFSQHIMVMLDGLIQQTNVTDATTKINEVLKQILQTPFSRSFGKCSRKEVYKYLADFVRYKFFDVSTEYDELIYRALQNEMNNWINKLNRALDDDDEESYTPSFAFVHLIYELNSKSIDNTIKMLNLNTTLITKVLGQLETNVPIDVITLNVLFINYLPDDDQITDIDGIAKIKKIWKVVHSVLESFESNQSIHILRTKWGQMKILYLYVKDVIYSTSLFENEEEKIETINKLWKYICDIEDSMETVASWEMFESFLEEMIFGIEDGQNESKLDGAAKNFKECCFQFFVDVVIEFCFSEESFNRLEKDSVIPKIMGYAFHQNTTKQFSPLEEYGVDNSPVIRSFILQQLLTRDVNYKEFLDSYLKENLKMIKDQRKESEEKDCWDVCKIFIYCYQDHLTTTELNQLLKKEKITNHYLSYITEKLSEVTEYLSTYTAGQNIQVETLQVIAKARIALTAVADVLSSDAFLLESQENQVKKEFEKLRANLGLFFKEIQNTDMHMFFHRHIIHKHGKQKLHKIIEEFEFVKLLEDSQQQNTHYDRFLVYLDEYRDVRQMIAEFLLLPESEDNIKALQHLTAKPFIKELVLLHCEIFSDVQSEKNKESIKIVHDIFKLKTIGKYKKMAKSYEEENGMLEFIYHLAVVLEHSKSDFIKLFKAFAISPQNLQGCFLPAMPSDNFDAIEGVQAKGRYECACGYPYVITECGRPAERFTCPECKRPMGGVNHVLEADQKTIKTRDKTKKGHCLGDAKDRPLDQIPERDLPRISVILQQMLIHLSMLLGALYGNGQAISGLIQPPVTNVVDFLTDHLKHDLFLIGKVFGKNEDDTKLLVHLLLKILMKNTNKNSGLDVENLRTKNGRMIHEKRFDEKIIKNLISGYEEELTVIIEAVIGDDRTMESLLMRQLYEVEFPYPSTIENVDLRKCYQLWSYRQPVTVQNFKLEIQKLKYLAEGERGKKNPSVSLLAPIMEKEDILSKISELSKLLELQSILMKYFNFRIDKKSALSMTIGEAIQEIPQDFKEIKKLVNQITKLWKSVNVWLQNYGRFQLSDENLKQSMDMKTPLAYFLCKSEGPGSCIMAMFDLLAFHQNEFLSQYKKMPGAVVNEVTLQKINKTDLITYSPEGDLLPVVYTHCHYSLELGKGTKIAYNMEKIAQHLVDKIYYGRSLINIVIKEFVYQDDVHNARKFNNLGKSIPQKTIEFTDQRNMVMELKEISDVSHALNAVEISIGFLTSTITPAEPEQPYHKYLTDVLKMDVEKFIPSRKMHGTLRLKHLYSAWLMLTVEKAIRLDAQSQNPFDCEFRYCSALGEENESDVTRFLRHVDLFQLLSLMTEYIVCGDINSLPDHSEDLTLQDSLETYEDQNEKEEKFANDLLIPDQILLKHLYNFWKAVVDAYKKKKDDI